MSDDHRLTLIIRGPSPAVSSKAAAGILAELVEDAKKTGWIVEVAKVVAIDNKAPASDSLEHLQSCLAAARAEPTNPFLVTQLEAAVSIHSAAEYLADRERRHARDLKQATLPEGYTLLRGEEHPGYEHGWTAPNGKRYGFWVSRETAREEAWNHRDTPDEFDDPGQLD